MWIPRYAKAATPGFDLVSVTGNSNSSNGTSIFDANGFYSNYFNLTGNNVAVNIQIKTNKTQSGYLVMIKLGDYASFDVAKNGFDRFKCFCPEGKSS